MDRTVDELDRVLSVDYPDDALDTIYASDTQPAVCAGASFPVGRLGTTARHGEDLPERRLRHGR